MKAMNATTNKKFEDILPLYVVIGGSVISITTILTNAFLLLALWRSTSTCKKSPTTVYLISLINCHLVVGIGSFAVLPGLSIANASYEQVYLVYDISGYFFRLILGINYCLLFAMLVDRMIAVKKPFLYQNFTWIQAVKTLLLVPLLPCLYLAILLINFEGTSMACNFMYAATGSFMVIGNAVIFMEVKNQLNKIRHLTSRVSTTDGDVRAIAASKSFKRQLQKSIVVSLLFTLTFILCWTPLTLKNFVDFTNGVYEGNIMNSLDMALHNSFFIIGLANSIFDPVVYVMLNRPIRKAILKTMKLFKTQDEGIVSKSKITSQTA